MESSDQLEKILEINRKLKESLEADKKGSDTTPLAMT